jgi:sulfopyruvate decarboxylase alpha subunit
MSALTVSPPTSSPSLVHEIVNLPRNGRAPELASLPQWAAITYDCLTRAEVGLVSYVPDGVIDPLITAFQADQAVAAFTATREDEVIGIACGASLGGLRTVAMMQTSGFGNVANALASLAVPYQIPVLMIISERGVLGEFNPVQVPITRVIRPTLDALGIPHVTLSRLDEVEPLVSRVASQCYGTLQPAALILSPLLTGGKVVR